jgi:hypothetical protein
MNEWWANHALMIGTIAVVLAEVAFCVLPIWV